MSAARPRPKARRSRSGGRREAPRGSNEGQGPRSAEGAARAAAARAHRASRAGRAARRAGGARGRRGNLFAAAVGPVRAAAPQRPCADAPRAARAPPAPARARRARRRCARRCPTRSTSNRCCSPTTAWAFAGPASAPDVPARLRRGQWAMQGELDLHGLRREEAREALGGLRARGRTAAACAACAWSTARATARRGASRCSRTRCSAGWRSAAR